MEAPAQMAADDEGSEPTGAEPTLVDLARKALVEVNPAEEEVLRNVEAGEITHWGEDDPAGGASWPDSRRIGARFVRWVLTSSVARKRIDPRGVHVNGAHVVGELDLRGAEVSVRASLHFCKLGLVRLEDARTRTFSLSGSECDGVKAQRVHVGGALFLYKVSARRFVSNGTVDLTGAAIDGELNCTGAHIAMTTGSVHVGALELVGARIGSDVFMDEGFEASGPVVLRGAEIGGALSCTDATIDVAQGAALAADAMRVSHSVLLDGDFDARGAVDLVDAEIGHNLRCRDGSFSSHGDVAINGTRLRVTGGVTLGGKGAITEKVLLTDSEIHGGLTIARAGALPWVELKRATVAGDVELSDVTFAATGERGMTITDASIGGALRLSGLTAGDGTELDFTGARVGALQDDDVTWPSEPAPRYEGLAYTRLLCIPEGQADRRGWVGRRVERLAQAKGFNPQPYDELAKALRQAGYEGDAVDVAVAREDRRRAGGGLGVPARLWSRLLRATIGSGYRPYKALVWSLALVAIGSVVFAIADADGHIVKTTATATVPEFESIVFSLDTFLPIADLQQERFYAPGGESAAAYAFRVYSWLHVLLGWVFVTLGLLGVTGLVRRD